MLQTTTIALSTIVHHHQQPHFPATRTVSHLLHLTDRRRWSHRHDSINYKAV